MSSDYTQLNPGVGGDVMDETGVTFPVAPTLRKRPRVVVTGEGVSDIVPAPSTPPAGTEPGLINRPIHSPYPGTPVASLATVALVPSSSETTIASYTVPVAQTFYFLSFVCSGDIHGLFKLYVDSTAVLSARTSVAAPTAQVGFPYAPFTAAAGQTVRLKVTHYASGLQGNFEATIVGYTL